MAKKDFEGKDVINGTWGELWVDDDYIGEIESFKFELNLTYSDVARCNSLVPDKKITKAEPKGSFKGHKVRDALESKVLASVKSGKTPVLSIVGKVSDPDVDGQTRVACKKCYLDKATLLDIENGKTSEFSYNFDCGEFPEYLDEID